MGGDLNRLMEILEQCQDVRFVADDIEFDSVEEFVVESRGKSPKVVKITAREPYLSIDFYPTSAKLYIGSSDLKATGIYTQLVSKIEECERRPRLLYNFWYLVTSTWGIQLFFALPYIKPYSYLEIWVILANLIWLLRVGFIHVRRFAFVQPIAAQDPRTFWQRNSDSTVVAIFSALLGALGGAAATKVADRIWPAPQSASADVQIPAAASAPSSAASSPLSTQRP